MLFATATNAPTGGAAGHINQLTSPPKLGSAAAHTALGSAVVNKAIIPQHKASSQMNHQSPSIPLNSNTVLQSQSHQKASSQNTNGVSLGATTGQLGSATPS